MHGYLIIIYIFCSIQIKVKKHVLTVGAVAREDDGNGEMNERRQ